MSTTHTEHTMTADPTNKADTTTALDLATGLDWQSADLDEWQTTDGRYHFFVDGVLIYITDAQHPRPAPVLLIVEEMTGHETIADAVATWIYQWTRCSRNKQESTA